MFRTERPSETCRVLFQNKINLRYCACGWFYYGSVFRCSVWQSEPTAITSTNRIKDLFFVIEKQYFWEVWFTMYSVVRQVHNRFQCVFSTERDLVFPLSISNILFFPSDHSVSRYFSFPVFSSLLAFLQ